jgi:hypothetical protein
VSKRWAILALCTLAAPSLLMAVPPGAVAAAAPSATVPALTLVSQSPWVTPTQPWFSLGVGIGSSAGPVSDLHASLTIYSRVEDPSQLEQATSSTPDKTPLERGIDLPLQSTAAGVTAKTCITVLPNPGTTAPTPGPSDTDACTLGSPTVYLDCTFGAETCGDVYPVSVSLFRRGTSTAISRFSTFITYVQPGAEGGDGSLRVGWIEPLAMSGSGPTAASRLTSESIIELLADHHDVPLTLAVDPRLATSLVAAGGKAGRRARNQLNNLVSAPGLDQLLAQPYVPISLAGLTGDGLGGEISTQMERGETLLRSAGLHPTSGTWVDTGTPLTSSSSDNLAQGLKTVRANHLVVSDADLAPAGTTSLTFAQTFSLPLGHATHVDAVAANSELDARFTANTSDPVLSANQLLAALAFIHFENPFEMEPRGVVIEPPPSWRPSAPFISTLLNGLSSNPVVQAVTLDQFFAQVPGGVNSEPSTRHLQSGPAVKGIPAATVARIAQDRDRLGSFASAVEGHPSGLTTLSDLLLTTENQRFSPTQRAGALGTFATRFDALIGTITLATERTVTFTSRKAPIPITVLSSAPYPVTVVLTLSSDKFTFPNGSTRTLHLKRPTTPVRIQARSRTSGDRLPVTVTLRTPDGDLVIAKTTVAVHSTSISLVGIALTVLAGLVLLFWWGRTWVRSRRRRPRQT